MKRIYTVLLALLIPLACPAMAQRTRLRSFESGESIKHPAKIPEAVLLLLRQDERVQGCIGASGQQSDIAAWFAASAIDLNDDRQLDLVVKPERACLFGVNTAPFWVFRSAGKGYKLVLKTNCVGLDILRTKTKGYHDIEIGAVSAGWTYGAIYKFDGKKYVPKKCWDQSFEEVRGGGIKRGRINYNECGRPEKPY